MMTSYTLKKSRICRFSFFATLFSGVILTSFVSANPNSCNIISVPSTINTPQVGEYDVFSTADADSTFQVQIENTSGVAADCRIFFQIISGVGDDLNLSGSSSVVDFQLFEQNQNQDLLLESSDSSLSPRISSALQDNDVSTHIVEMVIPSGQFAEAGSYSRQVRIGTYIGDAAAPSILDQRTVNLGTTIDPQGVMFVSVLGNATTSSGDVAVLDFDTITKDENDRAVSVLVISNESYRFSILSDNSGSLQLLNPPLDSCIFEDFISYDVRLNGMPVAVDGTIVGNQPLMPTDSQGNRVSFEIDLEEGSNTRPGTFIEGKLSGRYEDTLTFSIFPE